MAKVVVTLVSGQNLPAKDLNGLSDPYVILRVGRKSFRSSTKKKTLNPYWGESFSFPITAPRMAVLKLLVYDYDLLTPDDKMGFVMIPLGNLPRNVESSYTLKLQAKRKWRVRQIRGELSFKVMCIGFGHNGLPPGRARPRRVPSSGMSPYSGPRRPHPAFAPVDVFPGRFGGPPPRQRLHPSHPQQQQPPPPRLPPGPGPGPGPGRGNGRGRGRIFRPLLRSGPGPYQGYGAGRGRGRSPSQGMPMTIPMSIPMSQVRVAPSMPMHPHQPNFRPPIPQPMMPPSVQFVPQAQFTPQFHHHQYAPPHSHSQQTLPVMVRPPHSRPGPGHGPGPDMNRFMGYAHQQPHPGVPQPRPQMGMVPQQVLYPMNPHAPTPMQVQMPVPQHPQQLQHPQHQPQPQQQGVPMPLHQHMLINDNRFLQFAQQRFYQ